MLGQLTRRQMAKISKIFSALDVDGSGSIERSEVSRVYGGHEMGIFEKADLDGDGSITEREFALYLDRFQNKGGGMGRAVDAAIERLEKAVQLCDVHTPAASST